MTTQKFDRCAAVPSSITPTRPCTKIRSNEPSATYIKRSLVFRLILSTHQNYWPSWPVIVFGPLASSEFRLNSRPETLGPKACSVAGGENIYLLPKQSPGLIFHLKLYKHIYLIPQPSILFKLLSTPLEMVLKAVSLS